MFKSAMLIVFCQFILLSAGAQLPTINVTTNTNPSEGYTFLANFWWVQLVNTICWFLIKKGE
jgi:hypothetical protein